MHKYVLKNSKEIILDVRSEGSIIVCLNPGEEVCFFSSHGDLKPLFSLERIGSFVDVDPDFLLKCWPTTEKTDLGIWQQEGF